MKTLRYNPPSEWTSIHQIIYFLDFCDMLSYVNSYFKGRNDLKMIEIGSYMGESSSLFGKIKKYIVSNHFTNMKILMMISDILGMIKERV